MNIPCDIRSVCDCTLSPYANLSAEAVDVDRFFSVFHYSDTPPLGGSWGESGCSQPCYSTISQEDADLCALRQAQECAWGGVNGGPGWRTPASVGNPRGSLRPVFTNSAQFCSMPCGSGAMGVPAGTILAFSQAEADSKAHDLACKIAKSHMICFSPPLLIPNVCCLSQFYSTVIVVAGDTLGETNDWEIVAGAMPPGLNFFGGNIAGTQVSISGVPHLTGTFNFTVRVTTPSGDSNQQQFTLIVEDINPSGSVIPGVFHVGHPASVAFGLDPDDFSVPPIAFDSNPTFAITGGTLPTGMALTNNQFEQTNVTGTATAIGTFIFTVTATIPLTGSSSGTITCSKTYSWTIVP